MNSSRTIRIFASSPGDLADEREQLGAIVQELNSTVRALVPDKAVSLELIRWETHTHPDVARPDRKASSMTSSARITTSLWE